MRSNYIPSLTRYACARRHRRTDGGATILQPGGWASQGAGRAKKSSSRARKKTTSESGHGHKISKTPALGIFDGPSFANKVCGFPACVLTRPACHSQIRHGGAVIHPRCAPKPRVSVFLAGRHRRHLLERRKNSESSQDRWAEVRERNEKLPSLHPPSHGLGASRREFNTPRPAPNSMKDDGTVSCACVFCDHLDFVTLVRRAFSK